MWRLTCLVTSRVTPWHLPDLQQTQQYQTSANHCPSFWYIEQYGETDRVFLPGLKTRQAGEGSNWFREAGRTGFRLRAMSRFDMMDKTTEEVINSIQITEGPVTTMSLGVQKSSRTPYSDATKVSTIHQSRIQIQSERDSGRDERRKLRLSLWWGYCDTYGSSASRIWCPVCTSNRLCWSLPLGFSCPLRPGSVPHSQARLVYVRRVAAACVDQPWSVICITTSPKPAFDRDLGPSKPPGPLGSGILRQDSKSERKAWQS